MRDLNKLADVFVYVWETQLGLPCFVKRIPAPAPALHLVMPVLVLTGVICGAVIAAAGTVTGAVFNPAAGALIFTVLAMLFAELKNCGCGVRLLGGFFASKTTGMPWLPALAAAADEKADIMTPRTALFCGILLLSKAVLFFMLALNGAMLWAAVVFGGNFLIRGVVLLKTKPQEQEKPALRTMLTAAAVFGILLLPFFASAVLVAAALLWVGCREFPRLLDMEPRPEDADIAVFSGYSAELFMLALGILIAI